MILLKFKERHQEKSSFRWTLQFNFYRWSHPFNLDVVEQYKPNNTKEWLDSHTSCYGIRISKYWFFGFNHIYHDGPHCFLDLGFIHIQYPPRGGWCTKCAPIQ